MNSRLIDNFKERDISTRRPSPCGIEHRVALSESSHGPIYHVLNNECRIYRCIDEDISRATFCILIEPLSSSLQPTLASSSGIDDILKFPFSLFCAPMFFRYFLDTREPFVPVRDATAPFARARARLIEFLMRRIDCGSKVAFPFSLHK